MTTTTSLGTTFATPRTDWRSRAACHGTDGEAFFSDAADVQRQALSVCRRCPVRVSCLQDGMGWAEGSDYTLWGVAGGLTSVQRRALRCELLLGGLVNLPQARLLSSYRWAPVMGPLREWPADLVAEELRTHGVLASVTTVRLALWWTGAKATVLRPKVDGDSRVLWERVRDECEDLVGRLRELGLGNRDVAAYLGVSEDGLSRAVWVWRRRSEQQGVAA